MAFDYPVNLDLAGRRCLLAGSGPLALERLDGLRRSDADVIVVTPRPSEDLRAAAEDDDRVELAARDVTAADLDGVFLAIVTREDAHDVATLFAAAEAGGVLFAALDDVQHCHFGAMSQVALGDLRVTISSAGRAPALAKRLRRRFEDQLPPELGELTDAIDAVKRAHGPRQVDFPTWAAQWEEAMADLDGLVELLRDGRRDEVERRIAAAIATPAEG